MAGEWIKIQTVTPDKPEVFAIADRLGIDPDAVVGKLVRVWIWADQQTTNGNAPSVTKSLLDRITDTEGFTDAMVEAGWMREKNNLFQFVNFDRHNGQTSKQRALASRRVEKHRGKNCNGASVTKSLPEKRREEKSIKEETSNDVSSAQSQDSSASPDGPVMEFPCAGKPNSWVLPAAKVREWSEAYPGVDALAECRKALQWCLDNPTRIKTASGMPRFLSNWLSKAQNTSQGRVAAEKPLSSRLPTDEDLKNYTPY